MCCKELGETIDAVADKGYFKIEDIEACEKAGIVPYVPRPQRGPSVKAGLFRKDEFRYDADNDTYICPAGQRLYPYPTFTVCGPNLLECIHNSMAGQLCSANLMRTDAVQPVAKNEFIGEECDFGDFALKPQFAERRCILYYHRASFVAITPLPEFW